MTKRGKFVVIEGIDGSGKSDLINGLERELSKHREDGLVLSACSPSYESPTGWAAREALSLGMQQDTIDLLMAANFRERSRHVQRVLAMGVDVLHDRWSYSGKAYSTGTQAWYDTLFAGGPTPDLVIYLDVPVDIAVQRIARRGHELVPTEQRENLERVAHRYPMFLPKDALILDGTLSRKKLCALAWKALYAKWS